MGTAKFWAFLVATVGISSLAHGFGPLTSGGHMIMEEFSGSLRITLQIHRSFLPEPLSHETNAIDAQDVLKATLAKSPLMAGSGGECIWVNPGILVSAEAVTLQVLANCPGKWQLTEWDLQFLRGWPPYFTLFVEAYLTGGKTNAVLTPEESTFYFKGSKDLEWWLKGLEYMGLDPKMWTPNDMKTLVTPLGLPLWGLVLVLIYLSRGTTAYIGLLSVMVVCHLGMSLVVAGTPILQYVSYSEDELALAIACVVPFLWLAGAKVRYGFVALIGMASGLSLLQAFGTPGLALRPMFIMSLGATLFYLLAFFMTIPWIVLAQQKESASFWFRLLSLLSLEVFCVSRLFLF